MDIKSTTLFSKPYSLLEEWIGDLTNDIDNFLTDGYKIKYYFGLPLIFLHYFEYFQHSR